MLARTFRVPLRRMRLVDRKYQSTIATDINDPLSIDIDENGLSTLSMNQKPVNNLTMNFLKNFCEKMDLLEKERVKGMILTSSVKNVFCSGLDFNQTVNPTKESINAYWFWFQESWIKLYGASFPTVALINGHAIAGGCVYALACEYRVMLPNFLNGLNEAPVGIVPPEFVNETVEKVLGTRQAELALTIGQLYNTEESLKIGLIDEIGKDQDDARMRCMAFLMKFSKTPPIARSYTKLGLRQKTLSLLTDPNNRSTDAKIFCDYIMLPSTQNDLKNYFANLKKSKK